MDLIRWAFGLPGQVADPVGQLVCLGSSFCPSLLSLGESFTHFFFVRWRIGKPVFNLLTNCHNLKNRPTDIENKLMVTKGEREGEG